MNTILRQAILSMVLLCGIMSCDKVKEEDRWMPDGNQPISQESRTTVLVEEYTGQKCVNCPGAAEEIKKISDANQGRVIAVAMHAPSLGQAKELGIQEADSYAKEFGIPQSVPGIMINRKTLLAERGKYSQSKALWNALVSQAIHTKAQYRIDLNIGKIEERQITLDLKAVSASGNVSSGSSLGLQLWVVEDIRAEQLLPTGKRADYFHHNVFRGALNGLSGEEYTLNTSYNKRFDLPSSVKQIENAKVIAFVFDRSSREICEAAIVKLGRGIEPDDRGDIDQNSNENKGTSGEISFKDGDKLLSSHGGEIHSSTIEYAESLSAFEVISPIIYISGGNKERKGLTLEIVKDSGFGVQKGGLSQVCTDLCEVVKDANKYTKSSYELSPRGDDLVQIHYKIDEADLSKKTDYRVRLSIKDGSKELASLAFIFHYDPANKSGMSGDDPVDPSPLPKEPSAPLPAPNALSPLEPKASVKSNVVALDFTGKTCPACPSTIEALAEHGRRLGDNLIVVAIHSSYYKGDGSLWTSEGQVYESFNRPRILGYPTVVLNNKDAMRYNHYFSGIETLIGRKPLLMSALSAKRTDKLIELSFLSKSVEVSGSELNGRKLNVLFWVVENKVMDTQAGRRGQYEHNHVFRGRLNDVWGQPYKLGETVSLKASLPDGVKSAANTELIAIVLDEQTKEFIDAVSLKL